MRKRRHPDKTDIWTHDNPLPLYVYVAKFYCSEKSNSPLASLVEDKIERLNVQNHLVNICVLYSLMEQGPCHLAEIEWCFSIL